MAAVYAVVDRRFRRCRLCRRREGQYGITIPDSMLFHAGQHVTCRFELAGMERTQAHRETLPAVSYLQRETWLVCPARLRSTVS